MIIKIIDGITLIFIENNKGIISDDEIKFITNKHKDLLKEIDDAYR